MMCSHPFVERLIGTIRRECLDQMLFWTALDLETKLVAFRDYYNGYRGHAGLKGETPVVGEFRKYPEFFSLIVLGTRHLSFYRREYDEVVTLYRLRWLSSHFCNKRTSEKPSYLSRIASNP